MKGTPPAIVGGEPLGKHGKEGRWPLAAKTRPQSTASQETGTSVLDLETTSQPNQRVLNLLILPHRSFLPSHKRGLCTVSSPLPCLQADPGAPLHGAAACVPPDSGYPSDFPVPPVEGNILPDLLPWCLGSCNSCVPIACAPGTSPQARSVCLSLVTQKLPKIQCWFLGKQG